MAAPGDPAAHEVHAAVARVRRRMRWRVAARASVTALVALGLAAIALVADMRLGWLSRGAMVGALLAAATLGALAVLALAARPISTLAAARATDRALGLSDRLTSAVAFSAATTPSALERAAIADAARVSGGVDPRRVVAIELPRSTRALPFVVAALVCVALVRLPARAARLPVPPSPASRLVVEPDALAAERDAIRRLGAEARGKDPALAALAQKLDALLAAIDKQELSRAEAFERLAALEAALPHGEGLGRASARLAPAERVLAETKQTRALADAMKKDDLVAAQKELQRLATEAEAREKRREDRAAEQELERALSRASKALSDAQQKQDAERKKKIDELKEEERRLQKEKHERPNDEDTERSLQRNKRELERLEREQEEQAEQRRQLQRLSRELEEAAEQLRQKMSPEALRRAAEELSKMEDEIRKLASGQQAQMQIVELKEVLRRAGRAQSGGGEPNQSGRSGKANQSKPGQGKGDSRSQRLSEFDGRAGGQQSNVLVLGGDEPNSSTVLLPLPSGGQGQGQGQGKDPGEGKGGDGQHDPGGGVGDQHDPNLTGERTKLAAHDKLIHATGKAGQGPSRSQTILGASEKGFSTRDYQRVYKDYSATVEEVMSQEGVPPGYRYFVKRYFQLIRPRE